jgi:hypothetical protein
MFFTKACDDIGPASGIGSQLDDPFLLSIFQEVTEGAVAMIGLIEGGLLSFHRLFDHGGPEHFLILTDESHHRVYQELKGLFLLFREILFDLGRNSQGSLQVFVVNKLVTVIDQKVGTRFLHPEANHPLTILLQFRHEGREITVPGNDDKGIDVFFGITEIEGIHTEPDVCGILSGHRTFRDFDQFNGRLVERLFIFRVIGPIRISFLDDKLSLLDQAFQDLLDLKPFIPLPFETKGKVLKIDENR